MKTLSAIIIVKNEAENIARCLASLDFVDEIVVLDSGSDDDTVEICRRFTDKVFITDWPGFGPQKNRALARAQGEWVLSIDADEWVTPDLRAEILALLHADSTPCLGYQIPRFSYYCGQLIRYGDWRSDCPLRLFKRGQAEFSPDLVHESVRLSSGKVGRLCAFLEHDTFKNLDEMLVKMNLYSNLWATSAWKRGKRAGLTTAFTHSLWTFIRGYFLFGGFLDGKMGLILAISNAQGCYYRYLKLYLLQSTHTTLPP
jgi:glycosyltransferase involved in cell wall biosynthesis